MTKSKDIVAAAAGSPRAHVAALGRLAPFLTSSDVGLRNEACKLAVEIFDDYGGGTNPLPLVKTLLPGLLALAKNGQDVALPPLADLTWVLWRSSAYPELTTAATVLIGECEAKPDAKCLSRDARKGLGKGASRVREAWMYRRMLLEAKAIEGKQTKAEEAKLRTASGFPKRFQLAPPYSGAEGGVADAIAFSLLKAARALRYLAQGVDPCTFRRKPSIVESPSVFRNRAGAILDRVVAETQPAVQAMLARPRNQSKDDYETWRVEAWAEQALLAEMAGDVKAARARMTQVRDVFFTYGGLGYYTYQADIERLKVPAFREA
jgi:hypothetical protein